MRIKEIADAYDVKYELIGPNDPDLEPLIVFNKENACEIIEKLRCECIPITGCALIMNRIQLLYKEVAMRS